MNNINEGPVHILLVEDNPGDVRLIREALYETGLESSLTVVTGGEEALDYLYQRNGYESRADPDLVLLDQNLSNIPGRTVLKKIKDDSDLESVPVAIITSSVREPEIQETYEIGANGYFAKPADPAEFISFIQEIVESVATSGEIPSGEYSDIDHSK